MTGFAAPETIAHARQCADVLGEELLYWATEIARAEQAGKSTETQLQPLQSAFALARSQIGELRLLLGRKIELTDEQADAIVALNGELMGVADEYGALLGRAAALYEPHEIADSALTAHPVGS